MAADFGYDLWSEASRSYDAEQREAALDQAGAHMAQVMPFFLQAGSKRELEHRLSFAASRLDHIEASTGVAADELREMARRHYALLKEALPEGQDPLTDMMRAEHSYGSGPEKPDEHEEGPDFSHNYSEVPQGAPGGPDPRVVTPVFEPPQQPSEATASLRRQADSTAGTPGSMSTMPAGIGGASSSPDGSGATPPMMDTQPAQNTQTSQGPDTTFNEAVPQQVTSAYRDPVAEQIRAVASSVAASNPHLPEAECRRLARKVVGGYLRTADNGMGAMSDAPWEPSPGASAPSGGGDSSGGGGSSLMHGAEFQLGKGLMGGGGGAAAGDAAAGAGAEEAIAAAALL